MCGIFGQFKWDGSLDPRETLCSLTNTLTHRGPDEGGFWSEPGVFLGNRRLSIIDLKGGSQPMATADGRFVVVVNGEIYNYVEVREELQVRGHAFRTRCDTEVLLHGYVEWGRELPSHLVGMFAFAIYDRAERSLFLGRDPLGEKPLFFREGHGGVSFASEVKPLAALTGSERRLDETALGAYLCLNYVPGRSTLLAGVERLAPGTWRRYDSRGTVSEGVYWTPRPQVGPWSGNLEEAVGELGRRLDSAVGIALRSDVPVGLFLSGGMDSSLVAESAARQGRLKSAACLDFEEGGFSELPGARAVADRLGVPLERVVLTSDVLEEFLDIVAHADDPLADSSAVAVWTISREAKRSQKVVLSGDGGDEVFAGYLTYPATRLHQRVMQALPAIVRDRLARSGGRLRSSEGKVSTTYKLMRFLRAANLAAGEAHFSWNGTWLPGEAAELVVSDRAKGWAGTFLERHALEHFAGGPVTLARLQTADLRDYLPNDILAKVDRMSMAHGLEVRAPFLNPSIVELGLGLRDGLKVGPTGKCKRILRALARRRLGERVANAKKQGFSIPIHAWLRGRGRPLVEDLLSRASIRESEVLDADQVQQRVRQHLEGRRSLGYELWGLMVFMAWFRMRVRDRVALPSPALEEHTFPALEGRSCP